MPNESVVRAVDVGRWMVKYTARVSAAGVKCAMFPSLAIPTEGQPHDASPPRKTIDVPVDGLLYTVGPDVRLAAGLFTAQVLQHERYCETPEYMALTLGALHYMDVERIDLLVVGLPVRTMKQAQIFQDLQKRLRGTHKLAGGRTVHVARVQAVAQPAGSLMYYGAQHKDFDALRQQVSLVIDSGSRTFDWIYTAGMQQVASRSDFVPLGMFDVYDTIAQAISRSLKTDYRDYEAIDRAVRTGAPLIIFNEPYPVEKHLPLARTVPHQAVQAMLRFVGEPSAINNVILTGGGAFFALDAVKNAFPRHQVRMLKETISANVQGFQIFGMQLAQLPLPAPAIAGSDERRTAEESHG